MQTLKDKPGSFWFGTLFLALLGALTYLPLAARMGYINDDWYLMFDGYVGGASFFHEVFTVDRPLRGYVMQAAFTLFGMDPLSYHLSAFLFRLVGSAALFWIGNQLWQHRVAYNWLAALLFLVYPGFLSQVNPIDYQSQLFSLACGMVSVALTLKALQAKTSAARWGHTIVSVALAWMYLGLVEYFLGFEALRFAIIGVLRLRDTEQPVFARLESAIVTSLPFLAGAGGFLSWRLFFFESERRATDVGLQISQLFTSPLTGLWWLNYLMQDFFNVIVVAWAVPLSALAFPMRLRDMGIGFALAALAVLAVSLAMRRNAADETENPSAAMQERLGIAFFVIFGGLFPVILANRHVTLPAYSRYTLVASVGVAILFAVIIENISSRSLKMGMMGALVAISVLTHYGNAVIAANETLATNNFWRQVAWRAPQIKPGVTLIASFPGGSLSEDYFVWAPANFIYYPEKQDTIPIEIKLPAAVLTDDAVLKIVTGRGVETPLRRGNYLTRDFGNVLIMAQSMPGACVRILNGDAPELSPHDPQRIMSTAPYSRLENVIPVGESPEPSTLIFGPELEQGWCYYYEKADLARQLGDWEAIPELHEEALASGYYPEDSLEWMPFIQAYALAGDVEQVRDLGRIMSADPYLKAQACNLMTAFAEKETVTDEIKTEIQKSYCP